MNIGLNYTAYFQRRIEYFKKKGIELYGIDTSKVTSEKEMLSILTELEKMEKNKQQELKQAS